MFLRQTRRRKDGKTHTYWSVVENQRVQGGRVVQRHVLYLDEISPSQAAVWRKSIEVFDENAGRPQTLRYFPRIAALRRRLTVRPYSFACRRCGCADHGNGCVLAGRAIVGGAATGSLLVRASADQSQGHAVGSDPAGSAVVSADRAGERVEAAPRVVRPQRHGRSARFRFPSGRAAQTLRLS